MIERCCKNCGNYNEQGLLRHKNDEQKTEFTSHCWCNMDGREMCGSEKFVFFTPAENLVREDEKEIIIEAMQKKLEEM